MKKEQYLKILKDPLLPTLDDHCLDVSEVIFQWKNDSKYTFGFVKQWFYNNDVKALLWPANFPNINMIENAWYQLRHRDYLLTKKDELKKALEQE